MTVAELIEQLKKMPQDATACIDWAEMGYWSPPVIVWGAINYVGEVENVVLHDGDVYMTTGALD